MKFFVQLYGDPEPVVVEGVAYYVINKEALSIFREDGSKWVFPSKNVQSYAVPDETDEIEWTDEPDEDLEAVVLAMDEFCDKADEMDLDIETLDVQGIVSCERGAFVKYLHHGNYVWADVANFGEHRDNCLCYKCALFVPDSDDNCIIAQEVFENCKDFHLVTPVWECPYFDPA